MKRKITLLKIKTGQGSKPDIVEKQKTVWAEVSDVGVTTKFSAEMAGRKAEMQALMWRSEWENFTHAEFGGARFRIGEVGSAKSELQIKLILARG